MACERWTVQSEEEFVADFVVPCPHCGVACRGTFRAWYVADGKRITFETDRGSLEESLVRTAIAGDEYVRLPEFVRHWNEGSEWAAFGLDQGSVVSPDDLLATVSALEQVGPDEQTARMLGALRDLAETAVLEGTEVWVCET